MHFIEWNSCPSLNLSSVDQEGVKRESKLDVHVKLPVVKAALMTGAGMDWDLLSGWCILKSRSSCIEDEEAEEPDHEAGASHTFIDVTSNWLIPGPVKSASVG